MSGFSSNEISVIERKIEVKDNISKLSTDIDYYYEIDRCVNWLKEKQLHKVCLQFPDYLLCDSVAVALHIESKAGFQPYILGDTSYGSCCVDVVAAQHVKADGIIHFGHACLSPTSGLPILYIFEKFQIDVHQFTKSFRHTFTDTSKKFLLFFAVEYQHAIDDIITDISSEYHLTVTTLATATPIVSNSDDNKSMIGGRWFTLPNNTILEEYYIVFIGNDGPTLFNIGLTLQGMQLFLYDPSGDQQLKVYSTTNSKFLMKRMYLVERVKDATTLGILVGTLGVSNYLESVNRVKQLAKLRGKKCYIIAVGKPNVAKLANFPEIEVFVLVACPENSLMDSKEFFQPIVTPYELEIACNARKWTERYVLEFQNLLSGATDYQETDSSVDDFGDVSLVSGRVRSMAITDSTESVDATDAVALKNDGTISTVLSTGSKFLSERSWQGLEINLGRNQATIATQGRTGIPSKYDTDHETMETTK
ncbi:hypothetical protein L9F63_015099 [Diploptera punctata]|uniref:2-(3-amino-3-carboxypropyl)histidine synthase subunit 2 n=1 Tax=Diploptera punctata TaxID=6984 RepID=A0AAD8EJZ1_DIPPU|nr:hypothetical protein L9F63_015099 [Diploptera punctata]